MMKQKLLVLVGLATVVAGVEAASLAEARAKIGQAVSDAAVLASTMKELSAGDQVAFLAEVNGAIAKMPGSSESKAAAFLETNRAAIKAASGKGNVRNLLAEAFATVPLEALAVLNERFAAELFNRAANPSVTYTDDQFVAIVKPMMELISKRNAETDNPAQRDAFAALMFVRASNGTPADLSETLLGYMPETAREAAKTEWLPAALAEGAEKSYAPILDSAGAGVEPNLSAVVRIASPDPMNALLADLDNAPVNAAGYPTTPMTEGRLALSSGINAGFTQGGGFDQGLDRVPFNYSRRNFGTDAGTRGSGRKVGDGVVYAGVNTVLHFGLGQKVLAGSTNVGKSDVTIRTAGGDVVVIRPGGTIPQGGVIVTPSGADIRVPPGSPVAPGGTPIGPGNKPVGPGGRYIEAGGRDIEPGGYQYQNV